MAYAHTNLHFYLIFICLQAVSLKMKMVVQGYNPLLSHLLYLWLLFILSLA